LTDTIILETVQIVSTPDVLGGNPRIDGRRIAVAQVASQYTSGWLIDEIAEAYDLTYAQVHAALSYYYDHRAEIDLAAKEEAEWVEHIRKERRDFAGTDDDDVLNAVMTATAAAKEFGVTDRTVRDAIEAGKIEAIKSAGTWLLRRADAEARWGKKK
jgi:excisionase family DNA binding protein